LLGIAYQVQDDIADMEQGATINILNLLDSNIARDAFLQEASKSFVLEAKCHLNTLKTSEAKDLLIESADFIETRPSRGKSIMWFRVSVRPAL
jgi:geranylgeranyl pyrophosphate synthase